MSDSNWKTELITAIHNLFSLGIEKGVLLNTTEVNELTENIQKFENETNEFNSKENIKNSAPYSIEKDNKLITVINEENFKNLPSEDKKLIIALHELKITGYFFMNEGQSDDCKKEIELLEKMKLL